LHFSEDQQGKLEAPGSSPQDIQTDSKKRKAAGDNSPCSSAKLQSPIKDDC
jgi:hypothetical protein